ncbi:MAG: hypothetical protein GY723_14185 [bacterium]|nr:hypothetical protein [bacterium]MCP5066590.1 hypothetical protein [bacterium]
MAAPRSFFPPRLPIFVSLLIWIWAAPGWTEADRPQVGLDRLLELPGSRSYEIEKKGGRTPAEWRRRFTKVREALAGEKMALAASEQKLEEIAASTEPWQIAPPIPGATAVDAPLDYRLRQEIRRHRSEIERLETRLQNLRVEADLASVPPEWRS